MSESANYDGVSQFEANKWPLIAAIFAAGVIFLLVSEKTDIKIVSEILHLLGAFLVIAVPLEILRELFYEKANRNTFSKTVSDLFDAKIDAYLIEARTFGLDRIESSLKLKEMFNELKPGDTLWWLDTFCPGHKQWINNVEQAIQRGASVNMLIVDPSSPLCDMRAKEIGGLYKPTSFRVDLNAFIGDFTECRATLKRQHAKGNLNIILYDDLLGVPCYVVTRIDPQRGDHLPIYAYSSMYLTKPTGIEFPHFRWEKGSMPQILFDYVKEKYERFAHNKHSLPP